jgi:hypothetical protein
LQAVAAPTAADAAASAAALLSLVDPATEAIPYD